MLNSPPPAPRAPRHRLTLYRHCHHLPPPATIFQRFHLSRSEVLGSAVRADHFNPATRDVDFLIEFAEGATPGLQDFFGAKTTLEDLLARAVNLIEPGAVRRPCVLARIKRKREAMCAA